MLKWLAIIIGYLCLLGCIVTTISPEMRAEKVEDLAKLKAWQSYRITAEPFIIQAYGSHSSLKQDVLTIYIEGDGLAWLAANLPSRNPTPLNPVAFMMAMNDHNYHPIVYLARPCQYVFNKDWQGCQQAYWTNLRFSQDVITAMNQAIDFLKQTYDVKKIILIGYSGGGTIATLLAARRGDVKKLITVAAVLDLKQWIKSEGLSPMQGSLDPADEWQNLLSIPQTHWVGGKDKVVPKEIAYAFANHFPVGKRPSIKIVPDFDHICCWATAWKPS
jgi:hypothetical protein